MKRLWSADTFVDFDQSLNKAVNRLREALEDSTEHPRFVETLPRRGYRFVAPVTIENHQTPVVAADSALHFSPRVYEWPANPAKADSAVSGLEVVNAASPQPSVALRNWKLLTGILVVALAVIVAIGFGVARWRSHNRSFNLEKMEITKLTQSGNASPVAISPDGRYVVYGLEGKQGIGLWLRQVATHSEVQILPPEVVEYEGLSFSADGNYIYFVHSAKKLIGFRYLYVMPALGGPVRLLASDVDSPVSFSPDGRQFAYTRGAPKRDVTELLLASADGSNNRLLATIPETYLAFSPECHGLPMAAPLLSLPCMWANDKATLSIWFRFARQCPAALFQ